MKITREKQSNQIGNCFCLVMLASVSLFIGTISAMAQNIVELPQLVLEAKHTEYVETQNLGTPNIINVKSSNPSVARAEAYRVTKVQIVAVAPGSTSVEFFDTKQRKLYKVLVWVTAPNASGGGGQGYNSRLTQLPQIVMLVNRTENAHTPNDGAARISGVTSSNPSVATARADPPRGIQIYSKALGDTWINFTNNTTGTTYQVHIWVRNSLDFIPPSPGPNPNPNPNPNPGPNPGPNPKPNPGPINFLGKLDRCVVGNWSVTSFNRNGITKGGSGASLTIKSDGSVRIDYGSMSPIIGYNTRDDQYPSSEIWKGKGSGHISADKGQMAVDRVDGSNITFEILDVNGSSMMGGRAMSFTNNLGIVLGSGKSVPNYMCGDDTLTITGVDRVGTTWTLTRNR